jgi:sec-independent protein translocase protein TatC
MLGIVIAFQMPLVILLMGWMGLASADWLRAKRKYALVICAVVSAMITPADAVSMVMMLVPLYALYELGILLMVLAPASAVAQGRLTRFGRGRAGGGADKGGPDKPTASSEQTDEPAQPAATVARGKGGPEPGDEEADGGDGR